MENLKRAFKRTVACVVMTSLALTPSFAPATALDSMLDGMFTATTDAGAYKSQTRMGIVGGSVTARIPIRSYNIVSFDPPRLNAGCGGIDLYGGSFSFINADALVNMLRQIGQQAKGLLFKLAIDAINQMLGGVISEFAAAMQKMNSLMKNTCSIASALTYDAKDVVSGKTDNLNRTAGLFKSALGTIDSYFDQQEKSHTDPTAELASANKLDYPDSGNTVWRALVDSKVEEKIGNPIGTIDAQLFRELVISISGTDVMATSDGDRTPPTCPAGATCQANAVRYPAQALKVSDFVNPTEAKVWGCSGTQDTTNASACQNMQERSLKSSFKGTAAYTNKMLWGVESAELTSSDMDDGTEGIVNKLRTGTALSSAEIRFLSNIPLPVLTHLRLVQRQDQAVRTIAKLSSSIIAEDLALKLSESLIKAARQTFGASQNKAAIPGDFYRNLDVYQENVNVFVKGTSKDLAILLDMQEYVEKVVKSLPGAFIAVATPSK